MQEGTLSLSILMKNSYYEFEEFYIKLDDEALILLCSLPDPLL